MVRCDDTRRRTLYRVVALIKRHCRCSLHSVRIDGCRWVLWWSRKTARVVVYSCCGCVKISNNLQYLETISSIVGEFYKGAARDVTSWRCIMSDDTRVRSKLEYPCGVSGERRITSRLWAVSSVGRALRLQRSCRRFKSVTVHHSLASSPMM